MPILNRCCFLHDGRRYRFEMLKFISVRWQLHIDAVVLHEVFYRRSGPLKIKDLLDDKNFATSFQRCWPGALGATTTIELRRDRGCVMCIQ